MATNPSTDDLKEVITSIDSYSQQGFTEIAAIASLAIKSSRSPLQSQSIPSDVMAILHVIHTIATDTENTINLEAEDVGCNYRNKTTAHPPLQGQNLKAGVSYA